MGSGGWRASLFRTAFTRLSPTMDRRGGAHHRQQLLAQVTGTVVEIGAGTGATFSHYGPKVKVVRAIEPDLFLRTKAQAAAREVAADITVIDGTADSLPFDSATADWVVCSLVLCSVPDQVAALSEIRRVLKPNGQLAFYEHVRSSHAVLAVLEDLLTVPWATVAGGCHPNRDTLQAIVDAGFEMSSVYRFGFSPHPGLPRVSHLMGVARR